MSHELYRMTNTETAEILFKLLYVTRSEYDKGWHSTPHTHQFTELFYILGGKGSFILPDYEIPVEENDLVIINPNIEHTEKSNEQDALQYIALGIEGLAFSLPAEEHPEIGLYTYQGERTEILFYLNKILTEVQNSPIGYETVCQNLIEILLVKLKREKHFKVEKDDGWKLNKTVALVQRFIKENYRDNVSLDMLAKLGHINKYHLAHTFKKELGMSPIEYLNDVRMQEAKTLLETTDYTIGDVAHFNGFSSQSFFSQAFKRETGMSPSSYRKKCRKESQAMSASGVK